MMAEPDVDRFKVWPTQLDRGQFFDVIDSRSRGELERRHPLVRKKYARSPEPRPRMVEAYLFFRAQLEEFFVGTSSEPPLAAEAALPTRLEECFQALKSVLQVVVIDLEQGDDPQVIFETLNARGQALLPADLLRNYIFLRAARGGEPQEALYREYWQRFDEEFWRVAVKQGRLLRPRSDLFMQHFLASRQTVDIPITHLFAEYKFWIEREHPFSTVKDELATLAQQGDDFRRIVEPKKSDHLYPLATFLDAYDIRTAYPLLLTLLDAKITDAQWLTVSRTLESYLVRRAVCGLTTKNYNRIFLSLTRNLRRGEGTAEDLATWLAGQSGESTEWPSDAAFKEAWSSHHAYRLLNTPKLLHLFLRLNGTYLQGRMEAISIDSPMTVEHLLPQHWVESWPLPDGARGLTDGELWRSEASDPRVEATRKRNAALQTLGNLTILTQPLNSAVSNSPWDVKKPELLRSSLLPINQRLHDAATWDEEAISSRSAELFERALQLWPRS